MEIAGIMIAMLVVGLVSNWCSRKFDYLGKDLDEVVEELNKLD